MTASLCFCTRRSMDMRCSISSVCGVQDRLFRPVQSATSRTVAIKVLLDGLLVSKRQRERFRSGFARPWALAVLCCVVTTALGRRGCGFLAGSDEDAGQFEQEFQFPALRAVCRIDHQVAGIPVKPFDGVCLYFTPEFLQPFLRRDASQCVVFLPLGNRYGGSPVFDSVDPQPCQQKIGVACHGESRLTRKPTDLTLPVPARRR